jgi:hypothetical protein
MKATFNYIRLVEGKFLKTIETANVIDTFKGGIMVQSDLFPNGKCIASENVISIN